MTPDLPEFLLLLVGLLVVVTGTRVIFLYLPSDWRPRGSLERALRYAPLCALVALVVPQVFAGLGGAGAGLDLGLAGLASAILQDGRVPAALVALAVAALARQPLPGLVAGVAVLLLLG